MPAIKLDGKPDNSSDNYYYCDSQRTEGVLCPEFNVMQANLYSWRTTPYACDAPSKKGFFSYCDTEAKCGVDQFYYPGYGPGDTIIDTYRPFHTKIDFNTDEGGETFKNYVVTLSQDDQTLVMDSATSSLCSDPSSLEAMSKDLAHNMAFSMSIGPTKSEDWLQHGACDGTCGFGSLHKISNIKIHTAFHVETQSLIKTL